MTGPVTGPVTGPASDAVTGPTTSPDDAVLEVEDLRTCFSTPRGEVTAVDGVSLRVRAGETVGIVGESGSGKSVLGRTLMGLVSQGPGTTVSGTVRIAGHDVHRLSPRERRRLWGPQVAMVFQDPMTSLNPVRTIGAHLTDPLRVHLGLDRRAAAARALELLDRVGIPDARRRLRQYPHELSGGMRQRVMIAVALSCDPAVLVADEPTTALDVTVQKQVLDLLGELARGSSMATLLISHDLGAIRGRTDRVLVMYAGRLVEQAPTAALFDSPHHPYTDGLLSSVPDLAADPHTLLRTIDGMPPDLTRPPTGCRFSPRCPRATDRCADDAPLPAATGPHRLTACHHPLLPAAIPTRPATSPAPGGGP